MDSHRSFEDSSAEAENSRGYREIRFRHSQEFVPILERLQSSLLVSTYAAGKLAVVGTAGGKLVLSFHNFEQAMGVAARPHSIAVGVRGQIWFLHQGGEDLATRMEPSGKYTACYLSRSSSVTGNIHIHEMAWGRNELWTVNTLFSCLCTPHEQYSFVPRWCPPFISELRPEDRCHLNGLALEHGQPRLVTAMAQTNEPAGWRPTKNTSGCMLDVASGQVVTHGLSMPHSPRLHAGHTWVLHSGLGTLETVDLANGKRDTVVALPGFTRGLAFCGPYAFVGLSRIRETAVFGGVPIAEHRDQLKCGVGVINLHTGRNVAYLEFETGVEEVFAVEVLPGIRCANVVGPFPQQDGGDDVWVVPEPAQVDRMFPSTANDSSDERNK